MPTRTRANPARPLLLVVVAACLAVTACSSGETTTAAPSTEAPATTARPAPSIPPYTSEVYADPAHWLCRPDLPDDVCHQDLDATVVHADGTLEVQRHVANPDAPIDCFYVYPTISADQSPNSDLVPSDAEKGSVLTQAARLNSQCRVFAPVYRQMTLPALLGSVPADRLAASQVAYADVLDAWRHYLANDNDGRGVVLIGHSQGASHLNRLVREEIDPNPDLRSLLVAAYLIGSTVRVPDGADVGGDFANIPLCRSQDQIGCVVSYASFRSTSPPPANSFFGRVRGGDGVAACVNPAAPAGGRASLTPYFATGDWVLPGAGAARAITTPFVTLPDLLDAECVQRDGFSYLEVFVNRDRAGRRAQDITGDLTPEWGLHVVDVSIAMGDIERMVGQQAAAFTGAPPR
ncbi:DUF3089 domain-containing protein [Rhabdothermincola sp.]|uniref:DUF3089 domain-containing protein n=1 Tax=Rhabdothermincola sp. TaxID=2820405 RepID=UPI002FDF77D8